MRAQNSRYTIPINRAALSPDHAFSKLRMIITYKNRRMGRLTIFSRSIEVPSEVTIRLDDRADGAAGA